jgi:hypothetical protein
MNSKSAAAGSKLVGKLRSPVLISFAYYSPHVRQQGGAKQIRGQAQAQEEQTGRCAERWRSRVLASDSFRHIHSNSFQCDRRLMFEHGR